MEVDKAKLVKLVTLLENHEAEQIEIDKGLLDMIIKLIDTTESQHNAIVSLREEVAELRGMIKQ